MPDLSAGGKRFLFLDIVDALLVKGFLRRLQKRAIWAHRVMAGNNSLAAIDAEHVEHAFEALLARFAASVEPLIKLAAGPARSKKGRSPAIDKSILALPAPRRIRDRDHVKSVAKQPCLVCGRRPADAHHLRFAQSQAMGRKVSDEFTIPLCRGHHREVHRSGDEMTWWAKTRIDPRAAARVLWLKSHPLPSTTRRSKMQNEANLESRLS
jgi:hypothetical protein